jgi:hypothetical protein
VEEYLCLTLVGTPGESEPAFRARLTAFWSHFLRTCPDEYEQVYAEATAFGTEGECVSRQYMVGADAVPPLTLELAAGGIAFAPVDADEVYTRYEASGSEWFQIPH